ncbi:hypothetical protein BH09PLA1_BH09PLA1_07270 [soil metagenome]
MLVAVIVGAIAILQFARIFGWRQGVGHNQSHRLNAMRGAILGAHKEQIADVLGPPRATIGCGRYLSDDTWYYPLDARRRVALAIEFDRGVARRTQVIARVQPPSIKHASVGG